MAISYNEATFGKDEPELIMANGAHHKGLAAQLGLKEPTDVDGNPLQDNQLYALSAGGKFTPIELEEDA